VAEVVKRVERHDCREEIRESGLDDLYYGSIVKCSCGRQYIKTSDQREGAWWADYRWKPS